MSATFLLWLLFAVPMAICFAVGYAAGSSKELLRASQARAAAWDAEHGLAEFEAEAAARYERMIGADTPPAERREELRRLSEGAPVTRRKPADRPTERDFTAAREASREGRLQRVVTAVFGPWLPTRR